MAGTSAGRGGAPSAAVGGAANEPNSAGQSGSSSVLAGGSSVGGITSGTAGATGTPGSIRLDDLADYQVLQRALDGDATKVRVAGTLAGLPIATVQAQVVSFDSTANVIVPWIELLVTEAAYAGMLEVPQGGWYRTVVRGLDSSGNEVSRRAGDHRWGVGINILCIGQSNMVGHGGRSYTTAGGLAALYGNDRAWKHLTDPYDRDGESSDIDFDFGSGASLVPSLVNALLDYFPGVPIGVIPAAKGSSPLVCVEGDSCWSRRNADHPADPTTLYGNSLAKARRAGGVELIVMHQGETDATQATSRAEYAAELARLASNYRADLASGVPLFLCQLGRSTTEISAKNRSDTTMHAIRSAQLDADDPPRVYLAATAIDLEVDETDHYVKPTLDELGRRIGATVAYHYQAPGAPPAYRGPEILSASYADASRKVIDVRLSHRGGSDFAPAHGINGFDVLDDGAPVRVASAARKDPTTIRITLETAIGGVGAVRYLYGKLPFRTLTGTVHDDSALALPLEPTTADLLLLTNE